MTQDTAVRTQISALIFVMTNAVLFGAGLVTVLLLGLSAQATGIGIAAVTAFSFIVGAPAAWLIAPRLIVRTGPVMTVFYAAHPAVQRSFATLMLGR